MDKPGDTAAFAPLPDYPTTPATSNPTTSGTSFQTVSATPTNPVVPAASPEAIRALEDYLPPYKPPEPKNEKTPISEILVLVFGVILCGSFSVSEFNNGHFVMGGILAFSALFACAMLYVAIVPGKPASTPAPSSPVERLRAAGVLDAAALDFPRVPQIAEDEQRFGSFYLFNRRARTVHSYAEVKSIEVKELDRGRNMLVFINYVDGKTETLLSSSATPESRVRLSVICQYIQRGNPYVQILTR